jgi:hypothetical protein
MAAAPAPPTNLLLRAAADGDLAALERLFTTAEAAAAVTDPVRRLAVGKGNAASSLHASFGFSRNKNVSLPARVSL